MQGVDSLRLGAGDCERLRLGLVSQPVGTATSAAHVAAGAAVPARGRAEDPSVRSAPWCRDPEVSAFATLLTLVGVASAAFHGPQMPGARAL
jgi:hypothetical protein